VSLEALTEAALLGTARSSAPDVSLPGPLAVDGELAPERRLLRQAALLAVMRDAGALPDRVPALPEPAPEERRPPCPPAAAEHLRAILRGPYEAALAEWLEALARTGAVVPPEALRELLDRASADRELALRLERVLSERGRWLAAQREEWEWAAGGDPAELWQTGSRAARLHLLRTLRADHPDVARELLASSWGQEGARDREAFLAELETALGPADEPFLEACLDDRGQGVRATAAVLLSAIPGSALSRRMEARLAPLVGTKLRTLTVELPDGPTDADGLNAKRPGRMGERAWVLWQIVAAAPLAVWKRIDDEPAKLVSRRVADGMGDLLRSAWAEAAARQRDEPWAAALLDREAGDQAVTRRLIAAAPAAGERHVVRLLKKAPGSAAGLVEALPTPWSRVLSEAVAALLTGDQRPAYWAHALGAHGDPALADALSAATDPHVRDAAALLAFRRTMLNTLEETIHA
jgi:hypothetical protein